MALVLLMGIPAAGKTYLCDELVNRLGDDACVKFSFDEMFNDDCILEHYFGVKARRDVSIVSLYGIDNESSVRSERKRCEAIIRNYFLEVEKKAIAKESLTKEFFLIDDNFYLKSMRRPFVRMAKRFALNYFVIHVDTPIELALQRNDRRGRISRVKTSSIYKISEKIEKPVDTELAYKFTLSSSIDDLVALLKALRNKSKNEISYIRPMIERKRRNVVVSSSSDRQNHEDLMRALELDLRTCVSELFAEYRGEIGGKVLASSKKDLLKTFRRERITSWKIDELKSLLIDKINPSNNNNNNLNEIKDEK